MSTEKIMEQAQVFASAWSVVGGPFDGGDAMDVAMQEKDELKRMVGALVEERDAMARALDRQTTAAEQIALQVMAATSERDALASQLAELEGQEPVAWVEVVSPHEGPYNFNGITLLGKGIHHLYARPVPAEPVNARLLAVATGKIPHLYEGRCPDYVNGPDSRDPDCPACQAIAEAEAQQERLLQDMHDAGREIDRVMAESAPKAVRLTDADLQECKRLADAGSPVPRMSWSQRLAFAKPQPDALRHTGHSAPAKFRRGDLVRKVGGAAWQGRVVGEYSADLTAEGYAVESEVHRGSVQIYPAKALELSRPLDIGVAVAESDPKSVRLTDKECAMATSDTAHVRSDDMLAISRAIETAVLRKNGIEVAE